MAYIETGNASEAYRRTYDAAGNMAPQSIEVEASPLLQHPGVALQGRGIAGRAQEPARNLTRKNVAVAQVV